MNQNPGKPSEIAYSQAPQVAQILATWFHENARELPWRAPGTSAWGVLVSEVMSQQTQVERVAPIWQQWMSRWPSPRDLAAAPSGEVIRAWGALGYPRRALRLHETAGIIAHEHGNEVPANYEELVSLPGIGDYTASATLAFAFGQRANVLDTNVRRVLTRVFRGQQSHSAHLSAMERSFAAALIPERAEEASLWAESVMELGGLVCQARAPRCQACPLQTVCEYYRLPQTSEKPKKVRKTQRWEGSDRQIRGKIMKAARLSEAALSVPEVFAAAGLTGDDQDLRCLDWLVADGLLHRTGDTVQLPR